MGKKQEIERKFLVVDGEWPESAEPISIEQGYLQRSKATTVRIRLQASEAYLTIKGQSHGHARDEYEYAIPPEDARALLGMCSAYVIRKQRHRILHRGAVWEVDVFADENAGLVVAEIEAATEAALEDAVLGRPPWVGPDVTWHEGLFNARLSERPFSQWTPEERKALLGR